MESVVRQVGRLKTAAGFLMGNECFGFFERLRVLASSDRDAAVRSLLLKRLVEPSGGERYFSLCGYKIYFNPGYEVVDEDFFMKGITSLLSENFVFSNYFNPNVYVRKGDVVLDLGANIGTTSLLFSKIAGPSGRVFAFEPVMPDTVRANVKENGVKNIEVVPLGVSDRLERVEMEVTDYGTDSNIVLTEFGERWHVKKRFIDVTTLDIFARGRGLERIDFINMDIEGAEELAVRGAAEVVRKYRPRWSIDSYHLDYRNELQHDKLVRLFKGLGYNVDEEWRPSWLGEADERGCHIYAW